MVSPEVVPPVTPLAPVTNNMQWEACVVGLPSGQDSVLKALARDYM